jgi:prepilin-type N-terminal cleavage/methylation domain-containing protein
MTKGARLRLEAGITLIEMMIVVTIIALVAGVSYPSITSGLDSLRLRSATNSIVSLLNTALDRADRRQQAVEILISPKEEAIIARSVDPGFNHRIDLQDAIRITSVLPAAEVDPAETRRFLLYPGGTVPRIAIELTNSSGRKRLVSIDPVTGVPQAK